MHTTVIKGATSQSIHVFLSDSTSAVAAGRTGLAFGTAGLKVSYVKPGADPVPVTLVTQTPTGAYASGGFCELDATDMPGMYRLDLPNAAYVGGAAEQDSLVVMIFGASNLVTEVLTIQLKGQSANVTLDNVADAVLDRPMTEPTATFSWASANLRNIIRWLGALSRNKLTQSSTTQTLRNDADNANIATAAVSDAAGVFTRDEWTV